MWRIDSYGVSKARSQYFTIEFQEKEVLERILKNGLDMVFSMDYKTIICSEKDHFQDKIAFFLFDMESFQKKGEFYLSRIFTMNKEVQLYLNEELERVNFQKQVDSFDNGNYIMIAQYYHSAL
jgi:hypothetical protein